MLTQSRKRILSSRRACIDFCTFWTFHLGSKTQNLKISRRCDPKRCWSKWLGCPLEPQPGCRANCIRSPFWPLSQGAKHGISKRITDTNCGTYMHRCRNGLPSLPQALANYVIKPLYVRFPMQHMTGADGDVSKHCITGNTGTRHSIHSSVRVDPYSVITV